MRSPAPPVVALIGLLGILAGEQIVPIAKRLLAGERLSLGWLKSECGEHVFGALPTRPRPRSRATAGRHAIMNPTRRQTAIGGAAGALSALLGGAPPPRPPAQEPVP